jgi:hypothetical protein
MKKRDELVKLKEDYEKLKEVYLETAYTSLSEDEAKFLENYKAGKYGNDLSLLIEQNEISLQGLLPKVNLWYSRRSNTKENVDKLIELGFDTDLLTGLNLDANYDVHSDLAHTLREFSSIYYKETPIPLFIGVEPIGTDIEELKKRCKKEVYDKFHEATKNYIKSMLAAVTLLGELDFLLVRNSVNLEYLKKNFVELYNLYEDGKGKMYN